MFNIFSLNCDQAIKYRIEMPNVNKTESLMTQKMNENQKSILDLDDYRLLDIMKYIIADCELRYKSQGNNVKYANLVNFALAHEKFEAILEEYFKDLYKSLEFVFVAKRKELEIDFSELQITHKGKEGDAFWRNYANAIRENSVLKKVLLIYEPESYQPNFLDHFEIIKHALENKKTLKYVTIKLNGYSLEDLNQFGHITYLYLDVRMSADALVKVCKSNPHLDTLQFRSANILGRLSDIVPHCRNLRRLKFVAKPDIDGADYAPLAELPNLQEMTINRAFENGSFLTFFEAITKLKRPELNPLLINFSEFLPHLSNVTIARINSFLQLELINWNDGIELRAYYDFWDISKDSRPLEQSLATITLVNAFLTIDCKHLTVYNCPTLDNEMNKLTSLLKTFNIETLSLKDSPEKMPIAKLFASMASDESYAVKSINIPHRPIDKLHVSELVKIKSITSLTCQFSDWESVELLSELTNLENVTIRVDNKAEINPKTLCSFLKNCSASGVIKGSGWSIHMRKNESIINQNKTIKSLNITDKFFRKRALLLKAFSSRNSITIEELYITYDFLFQIKDIMQPIKKLGIWNIDHDYIWSLPRLPNQLVQKTAYLQCLEIYGKHLSTEDLVTVSRIRTLKKLDLRGSQPEDCASLMELANSNIEELTLAFPPFSLKNLFSAFATKATSRLQHLELMESNKDPYRYLELGDLQELFNIKSLRGLQCTCLCNDVSFLRNFKHLVKLDIELLLLTPTPKILFKLENFDSLTMISSDYNDVLSLLNNDDILSDLKNLNLLRDEPADLTKVFETFASKSVSLTHLNTLICSAYELSAMKPIKSLKELNIFFVQTDKIMTSLGELPELKSLRIYNDTSSFDFELSILKGCRNLDSLLIIPLISDSDNTIIRDFCTLLKSATYPTHQRPLTVIIEFLEKDTFNFFSKEYNIQEILKSPELSLCFKNDYLKLFSNHTSYFQGTRLFRTEHLFENTFTEQQKKKTFLLNEYFSYMNI